MFVKWCDSSSAMVRVCCESSPFFCVLCVIDE